MRYQTLGHTGIKVSALGLGTVKLGRADGLQYPREFTIPDDRQARLLFDAAADAGINLIDTAPAYGNSEERIGKLIAGNRRRWVICTKTGEVREAGVSSFDFSPESIRQSVKRSLQRIRTDFIDIVLIHSDGNDVDILDQSGAFDCLRDLKARGWIGAVGISHKTIAGAERAIAVGCDVIMATLNAENRDEASIIAAAGESGCGVLIKKAMASGHADTASLAYAVSQPGVSSVITGTISTAHLRENVAAVSQVLA